MSAKTLIILIGSDPQTSSRAGEAVRIAAGVGAWQKVLVSIYLHGPAAACLKDFRDELEGGNMLAQYLPMIPQHGGKIYVEAGNVLLKDASTDLPFEALDSAALGELLKRTDCEINFDVELRILNSREPKKLF